MKLYLDNHFETANDLVFRVQGNGYYWIHQCEIAKGYECGTMGSTDIGRFAVEEFIRL